MNNKKLKYISILITILLLTSCWSDEEKTKNQIVDETVIETSKDTKDTLNKTNKDTKNNEKTKASWNIINKDTDNNTEDTESTVNKDKDTDNIENTWNTVKKDNVNIENTWSTVNKDKDIENTWSTVKKDTVNTKDAWSTVKKDTDNTEDTENNTKSKIPWSTFKGPEIVEEGKTSWNIADQEAKIKKTQAIMEGIINKINNLSEKEKEIFDSIK